MADILVTGATGFIGSHLVEVLGERGTSVRALVRERSDTSLLDRHGIERVVGELADPDSLRRALADAGTVLHLAGATRAVSRGAFEDVNEGGTRRLLDAMEADGGRRRLVYLSSLAAVGPARERPVRPTDEPRPLTAYGRSKLAAEREALGRTGVDVVVLRPPAVYGPRDRDLLTFFRLARWRVLPVPGGRERPVQMVHARDLAEAVLAAAESGRGGSVYHIAEPAIYGWTEVLDRLADAVGRRGVRVPVPATVVRGAAAVTEAVARVTGRAVIFDRDKAREVLAPGWLTETETARRDLRFEARIALAEGLRETAAWYRAYGWL